MSKSENPSAARNVLKILTGGSRGEFTGSVLTTENASLSTKAAIQYKRCRFGIMMGGEREG